MAKVLEEALSMGKMLFYHFTSILFVSMSFFTDAYDLFWFYLISKLFGRRFYFSNQFLVPIIKSELVLSSTEKGKHNKIVDYILYCSSKVIVQIKIFCKRYIYITYGLWSCLVGLILRLDVCVIVVCMLVYR